MMFLELIQYSFIQKALIAGILVAFAAPIVGIFLILKKMSVIGDGLAHVAFGGVSIGLFLGIYPMLVALIASILSAIGIMKIRSSSKISGDAAIAIFLSAGLAIGMIFIGLTNGFSIDIFSILFGSILLVTTQDLYLITLIVSLVILVMLLFIKTFFFITVDEEAAQASGISTTPYNYLLAILTAILIVACIRVVGILLVSSLIVIPNLASMQLNFGFKKTLITAIIFSELSVVLGILLSFATNLVTSGTIVFISISFLILTLIKKRFS